MSDDALRWRQGARHPGHDYGVFSTAFVDATHPGTGASKRFSLIQAVDWVNVIAITPDDRIVLIRQYRAGTDSIHLEIPGGMIDPGERPEVAAARELAEETGFTSIRWQHLGTTAPNPALQGNHLHTFLALAAVQSAPAAPEGTEVIELSLLSRSATRTALRTGAIDHALVVAAFGLYELHRTEQD